MKKLTYDQVDKNIELIAYEYALDWSEKSVNKTILWPVIKGLIDSINENIEDQNNIDYVCNKCNGYLKHTGEQKTCSPPIDIYKCSDCGEIVEVRQKTGFIK